MLLGCAASLGITYLFLSSNVSYSTTPTNLDGLEKGHFDFVVEQKLVVLLRLMIFLPRYEI
jgi:hypothetical protein